MHRGGHMESMMESQSVAGMLPNPGMANTDAFAQMTQLKYLFPAE